MKFYNILLGLTLALIVQAQDDDKDGFVEGGHCEEAQDCYINDGDHLALACFYNVKKCKCYNTIQSIYHLTFDKKTKQCQSSKYGHCGKSANGGFQVGCSDGFVCIENRCRDPKDTTKAVLDAFRFPVRNCEACRFSQELNLECDWNTNQCLCKMIQIADKKGNVWDIRNYDGNHKCSVSQFGPCGIKNGVTIECHGEGMSCVNGLCTNPKKPRSSLNEICQEDSNCDEGLLCADSYRCIKPKSSGHGVNCNKNEECAEGLFCKRNPAFGPWSSKGCYGANEFGGPKKQRQ